MKTFAHRFLLPMLPLFALFPIACDDESSEEEDQPTEWTDPEGEAVTWEPARPDGLDWELKDTTTYIKAPASDLVTVLDGSLRVPAADFPELASLEAGTAIIGNPHADFAATNPIGFIRKVVSVSEDGDELVIETEAATLADAFESCDMVATIALSDFEDLDFVAEDGTKLSPKSSGEPEAEPNISFNKAGTILFDADGLKATLTKANFQFAPSFNFDLDASVIGGLKRLSAVATGNQSAELEVKLETTEAIDKSVEKVFSAPPIPIPLGPLVVTATPKLVLGCELNVPSGMNVVAGVKQTSSVAIGAVYTKEDGLDPVAQSNFTLNRLGPTFNTGNPVEARCYIRPELHAGLNIVVANAGVKMALEGFADVSANVNNNVCKLDMDLGVKGTVGVNATAFGFEVVDQELTLFTKNVAILNDANCVPAKKAVL